MATSGNNVRLPEDLVAELKAQAQSRGLTPDELAVEALRAGLRQQSWQAKAARWQEYGKASGYTADDVPDAVRQWRNEQHGR
jgi:predicted transcriptional regulator